MRVMVTGATAPLGAELVYALLRSPDVELVLAVGRHPAPPTGDPRHVWYAADLTRAREVRDLLRGEALRREIDVVIHSMQHRRMADRGPRIHRQNVEATRELVAGCIGHPTIRRLVYRSFGEVYALDHTAPNLLDEESPLDFDPASPQWVRDRVEADLTACAHFGSSLAIAVLRCAEILAPGAGSQLWDYLQSRVCLRPLGFDPMINVLSLDDAVRALATAARSRAAGVFNIPGLDTLPLSAAIAQSRRGNIPVPGPLMTPLYALRRWVAGFEFRYDANLRRFHFGGVLDGTRARRELGYVPRTPVVWPKPAWKLLLERLASVQVARP